MPLNAIIAESESRGATTPSKSDAPPVDEPSDEPKETFMRTGEMMPPYLHVQTFGGPFTAYSGAWAVLGLVALIKMVR